MFLQKPGGLEGIEVGFLVLAVGDNDTGVDVGAVGVIDGFPEGLQLRADFGEKAT